MPLSRSDHSLPLHVTVPSPLLLGSSCWLGGLPVLATVGPTKAGQTLWSWRDLLWTRFVHRRIMKSAAHVSGQRQTNVGFSWKLPTVQEPSAEKPKLCRGFQQPPASNLARTRKVNMSKPVLCHRGVGDGVQLLLQTMTNTNCRKLKRAAQSTHLQQTHNKKSLCRKQKPFLTEPNNQVTV